VVNSEKDGEQGSTTSAEPSKKDMEAASNSSTPPVDSVSWDDLEVEQAVWTHQMSKVDDCP